MMLKEAFYTTRVPIHPWLWIMLELICGHLLCPRTEFNITFTYFYFFNYIIISPVQIINDVGVLVFPHHQNLIDDQLFLRLLLQIHLLDGHLRRGEGFRGLNMCLKYELKLLNIII